MALLFVLAWRFYGSIGGKRVEDAHFRKETGDFALFFSRAFSFSALPSLAKDIHFTWDYKADPYGMIVLVSASDLPKAAQALKVLFGAPEVRDTYPYWVFQSPDRRVSVLCNTSAEPSELIFLRYEPATNSVSKHSRCLQGMLRRFQIVENPARSISRSAGITGWSPEGKKQYESE